MSLTPSSTSRVTSQQLSSKLVYHVEETIIVLAVFALLLTSHFSLSHQAQAWDAEIL